MQHPEIVDGIARALWVDGWADACENGELPHYPPGCELTEVAPETPPEAYAEAYRLLGMYEALNGTYWPVIVHQAKEADGGDVCEESFGHYLTMMAIGHGVSWFDDHQHFDLKVPYVENPFTGWYDVAKLAG